jgi:spermidine/putrescine-binding protein
MTGRKLRTLAVFTFIAILTVALAACGGGGSGRSSSSASAAANEHSKIVVGGWGGEYDKWTKESFAEPFGKKTGTSFVYDDAPSEMVAKVKAQSAAGQVTWDVLDSAFGLDAWTLWNEGLLAPAPKNLESKWKTELGASRVTPFGYSLGNLGDVIVCNREQVEHCPTTPAEFFNTKEFPGPRAMYGAGPLVGLMLAAEANGAPKDQIFPIDLDSAFEKLEEVKPEVKLWYDSPDQLDQAMINGEVSMAIAFNGRVANLIKQGLPLEVSWNGAVYEPVYMTVVKGAPEVTAAWEYLDFIAESPKAQAKYVELTGYGVPSEEAFDLVPKKIAKYNPDYPPNFKQMAIEDLKWYQENQTEVDSRWRDFVGG